MKKYFCLCCGYKTLKKQPLGTFEVCPMCFWEDDLSDGGANKLTLKEAKDNYERYGVSDLKHKEHVRQPAKNEERHPNWKELYWPNK